MFYTFPEYYVSSTRTVSDLRNTILFLIKEIRNEVFACKGFISSFLALKNKAISRKLGNIATDDVADIFLHHPLLQKVRTIKASDIPECKVCSCVDYCSFSPMAHLNANRGELYKLDALYCKYIAQVKKYGERFTD